MHLASNSIATLLWTQTWQLAILATVVALVVKLAGRRRPHLAYLLWMLVVVKALTPPVWSSPTGLFSWAMAETQTPAPPAVKWHFPVGAKIERVAEPSVKSSTPKHVSPVESSQTSLLPSLSANGVLVACWAVGSMLLLAVTTIRWVRMKRLLRRTSEPVDPALAQHLGQLARQIGLRSNVRLVLTSAPLGPAALGWWPGTVVLPAALARAKRIDELTPILAHELVHLRRWDTVAGSVQLVAQLAWWFHPGVWWANRQARAERERCCDEEVVAELACPPADYARTLVEILEWRHRLLATALPWPAMRAWDVTSERLEHLLRHAHAFRRRGPAWCWLVLVAVAAVVLPGAGLQLVAAPPEPSPRGVVNGTLLPSADLALADDDKRAGAPAADLEPTAEQRAIMAELEKLGLRVSWNKHRGKPHVSASFSKDFKPLDKPLPLEKLPGLEYLSLNRSKQSDEQLDAQLRALKNLRPETKIELVIHEGQSTALNRLAEIPGLAQLMIIGKLPPLVPAGSAAGRTIRLNQLKGLKMLLHDGITDGTQLLGELDGLTGLEELYLQGQFTDANLAPLAKMTSLKFLSLTSGQAAATLDAPWLVPLVRLERLTIGQPISDSGTARIGAKTGLKLLGLESVAITDDGLKPIANLQGLRVLHLFNNTGATKLGPDGLRALGRLTQLRSLSVSGPRDENQPDTINDEVLAAWQGLADLRSLSLSRCNVSDRGMAALASLPKLRTVSLFGHIKITDQAKSLTLECRGLTLSIPDVTNDGMSMFGKLTNLATLGLGQAKQIDAKGLDALTPLKKLESFTLHEARLDGPGAALAELRSLKKLDLSHCRISDDAMAEIGKLQQLESLALEQTGVTNAQLKSLAALDSLETLNLTGNPIDDAGLEALRPLKALRHLQLADAKTTEEGRVKLAQAIPGLKVDASGILGEWATFVAWDDELMDDPAPQ